MIHPGCKLLQAADFAKTVQQTGLPLDWPDPQTIEVLGDQKQNCTIRGLVNGTADPVSDAKEGSWILRNSMKLAYRY